MNLRFCNLNSEPRTPACAKRFGEARPNSELLLRNKGFTLIEIIIVIVILAIAAGITIKFLIDSMQIYTMTVNQKTLYDEGKLALERMCRDIRDASSISSPAPSGSGSLITFARTHTTIQDGGNETITFQRNIGASTLEKVKTQPSAVATMASNVSAFTVTRDSGYEIQLQLTLNLASGENVTLQTKVYPKNLAKDPTYKNFYQNWAEVIQ